jgi:hypothetical protein
MYHMQLITCYLHWPHIGVCYHVNTVPVLTKSPKVGAQDAAVRPWHTFYCFVLVADPFVQPKHTQIIVMFLHIASTFLSWKRENSYKVTTSSASRSRSISSSQTVDQNSMPCNDTSGITLLIASRLI